MDNDVSGAADSHLNPLTGYIKINIYSCAVKQRLALTSHLLDVHEPAHEAGVGEEQLKHLARADVEHPV